jgi:hypothetical protein
MADNLTQCKHCGSELAYENIIDGVSYEVSCISCGFMTNSNMLSGTEELKIYLESIPDIYSELKFIDEDGFCWVPMYKEVEGKGAISINGISKDRWLWSFIPHVLLKETDPEIGMYTNPDGSHAKYKFDFKSQEYFGKSDFLLALHKLGYFTELQSK